MALKHGLSVSNNFCLGQYMSRLFDAVSNPFLSLHINWDLMHFRALARSLK